MVDRNKKGPFLATIFSVPKFAYNFFFRLGIALIRAKCPIVTGCGCYFSSGGEHRVNAIIIFNRTLLQWAVGLRLPNVIARATVQNASS